jgi:hypothetical protein
MTAPERHPHSGHRGAERSSIANAKKAKAAVRANPTVITSRVLQQFESYGPRADLPFSRFNHFDGRLDGD